MHKPRQSNIQIISKYGKEEQTAPVWGGVRSGELESGRGVGMTLAVFIISLLVCFDFLKYVHVLLE